MNKKVSEQQIKIEAELDKMNLWLYGNREEVNRVLNEDLAAVGGVVEHELSPFIPKHLKKLGMPNLRE